MGRHETVHAFGSRSENRGVNVPIKQRLLMGVVGECTESSFSTGVNCSVRLDKVDSGFKLPAVDFREARRNGRILERQIVQAVAGDVLPASNPDAAEVAVAVIDHEWLCRRNCDLIVGFHFGTNN